MSFDKELLALMPHTVSISLRTAVDAYGKPTYGTAVNYRARHVERTDFVRDNNGQEVTTAGRVYVAPDDDGAVPSVTADDRITLPDGSTPPIVTAQRLPDEDGDHHALIFLGASQQRGRARSV